MLMQDIEVKVYRSAVKIPVIFFVPAAILVSLYALLYLGVNSNRFLDEVQTQVNQALPGSLTVTEIQVEPTMIGFHIYEASLFSPDGAEVIRADEAHATLNPLVLLAQRIEVRDILVRRGGVRMSLPEKEDARVDLLTIFFEKDDEEEKPEEPSLLAGITLRDIKCEDCFYSFDLDFMRVDVPNVDIPDGRVDISENLVMHVENLGIADVMLNFKPRLFRFRESQGDWNVHVTDFALKNWHWTNEGFNVESLRFESDGMQVNASGDMRFPDSGPDERAKMLYSGQGEIYLPIQAERVHYFVNDFAHAELTTQVAVEGSLEEIRGIFELQAPYMDAYGLQATNVVGRGHLVDDIVSIDNLTGDVHGGTVELSAFFSMFTGIYSGDLEIKDTDPSMVVADFGFDYPWLAGRASSKFSVLGYVPYEPNYKVGKDPLAWVNEAVMPIASIKLMDDLVINRTASGFLPGSRIRVGKGAYVWANFDMIGAPRLNMFLDGATVRTQNLFLNWQKNTLVPWKNSPDTQISIESPDFGRLAQGYGLTGVGGSLSANLKAKGRLNYPTVDWQAELSNPTINVGTELSGRTLKARGTLEKGRLNLPQLALEAERGSFNIKGWIDVLRNPAGTIDPETNKTTTDYLLPARNRTNLAFDIQDLDMRILKPLLPDVVGPRGRAFLAGNVRRTIQDPEVDLDARIDRGEFFGQPLRQMEVLGTFSKRSADLERAVIDAGVAGRIEGTGSYDLRDDVAEFDLTGAKLDLERIVALQEQVPYAIEGIGNFRLEGSGSPRKPQVGGYVGFERLKVDEREIGNLTLVANTLEDTIHFVGALLPWITVDLELPLDDESPFYVRLGLDHIRVSDAVAELRDNEIIEEIEATGMVEFYLEKDFSRYQVLADLNDIKLTTLGRTFQNQGPVIVGLNDGELVQLQQATIGADGKYVSVQGGMFLDQALLDLTITGDLDLALVNSFRVTFPQYFPEWIVETKGLLTLDTNLRGTPGNLEVLGFVKFSPTQLQLRDLGDPIEIRSGTVRFQEDGLAIDARDPIRGRALQGSYRVLGRAGFDGFSPRDLALRVQADAMSYRLPEVANLTFGADLRVDAPDLERPETWKVTGDVDVLDGLYYENISIFQEQFTNRLLGAFSRSTDRYQAGLVERFPMLEEMQFDVKLRARDGFRIQSEIDRLALDLELRVDVALRNTLVSPNVTGDVDVVDGRVTFQGERFEVRNGQVSFLGSPDNPTFDIIADAEVANRCREPDLGDETRTPLTLTGTVGDQEQRVYSVTLNVRGRLDKLDVQFESNPYADQRDILSLILTGCTVDQLTASSASSPTLEVALAPVLGWIEGTVEDVVAVEEFTITPSVDRLRTSIGDRLSRRVSWRLQVDTGLAEATGGQRAQLNYKLTDAWSAEVSESSRTEDDTFVLDFKLRYRYFID